MLAAPGSLPTKIATLACRILQRQPSRVLHLLWFQVAEFMALLGERVAGQHNTRSVGTVIMALSAAGENYLGFLGFFHFLALMGFTDFVSFAAFLDFWIFLGFDFAFAVRFDPRVGFGPRLLVGRFERMSETSSTAMRA
jgi:hypothetical protein